MNKTSQKVVFFGSGPVAAKSLQLLAKNFAIEAVVTKPKPSHHRGSFPVLDVCGDLKIPFFTVSNRSELSTLIAKKPFTSPLGVLIDFGIIVGQDTIDYFALGIVNSHFSILPDLRGADPITFAILSGQQLTGVSLMMLVAKMDEGPLVGYGEQPLDGTETTPLLTDTLVYLSDALLAHDLPLVLSGKSTGVPQTITGRKVSYSRKLTKQDGTIYWSKSAVQLEREVRAYAGWPKSTATLAGKSVIITKSEALANMPDSKNRLIIKCGRGYLEILTLKPAGKQEMTGRSFLAGHSHLL